MKTLKRALKWICAALGAIVALVALLFLFLTVTEYNPADVEKLTFTQGSGALRKGEALRIISWNIGYAGMGAGEQFIMDGGGISWPSTEDSRGYLDGIKKTLADNAADIYLLQEVDEKAARSSYMNQRAEIAETLGMGSAFAANFSCPFLPLPLPVVGDVKAGLQTLVQYPIAEAERIKLPTTFRWPLRIANLKRCLLITRLPIDGADDELVLINLHMEAYDEGDAKAAQTAVLMDIAKAEYDKGNYVIAGGDWNQTFPGVSGSVFPEVYPELWRPAVLEKEAIPAGFTLAADATAPSYRLANKPYSGVPEETQFYIIDGFLVSPNVEITRVGIVDEGFKHSDHQPLAMEAALR